MSKLNDLVTNAPSDFSSEYSIFAAIPWGEIPTKNVSLIRCIMTLKNIQEAGEILKALKTEEYKKFVASTYPMNPTIKLFIEKLIALPDINEPAPLQTWLDLITYLNKDGSFSKTNIVFESIWNHLIERVAPLVITVHKEAKEFSLTTSLGFFFCGFKTEVSDSFKEKISRCTDLDEARKIGSWVKRNLARYESTPDVSRLAYELCEKIITEYLAKEKLTFDDYKKLYDYVNMHDTERPISKELVATINEASAKFFDQQIASETTPWAEVEKIPAGLNIRKNLAYHKREIREVSFEKLKSMLAHYASTMKQPDLSQLTFLNLLRQEEIIRGTIDRETDIQKLFELKKTIPDDLKYLNADLLKKTQVLLGN